MRLPRCRWALLPMLHALAAAALANGHCPAQLRVGTLDYALPPYISEPGEGPVDELPGQLGHWLHEAMLRAGCGSTRLIIQRLPVWRGYEFLKRGDVDLWVPTTASEQSLQAGLFPLQGTRVDEGLGFTRTRYSFYVLKGNNEVHWDGKTLSGPASTVLGISNATAIEQFAKARGFATESATNINQTINKLLTGRVPVVLVPDLSVQVRAEAEQARMERLEPEAMAVWFYATFGRNFARQYPRFAQPFWLALCQVSRKDQPDLPRCATAP